MIKILIAACAALALVSCGSTKNTPRKRAEVKNEASAQKSMMTGAYTDFRPLNEEDLVLFGTVTRGLTGVSYTPESVATQVVAGTNYRFICKAVTATREPETYRAEVVVFQPLPGRGDARITKIKRL